MQDLVRHDEIGIRLIRVIVDTGRVQGICILIFILIFCRYVLMVVIIFSFV
jgi:hypothetical protein